jgi:hypothetical protein
LDGKYNDRITTTYSQTAVVICNHNHNNRMSHHNLSNHNHCKIRIELCWSCLHKDNNNHSL